jgi:hypothetical protein
MRTIMRHKGILLASGRCAPTPPLGGGCPKQSSTNLLTASGGLSHASMFPRLASVLCMCGARRDGDSTCWPCHCSTLLLPA